MKREHGYWMQRHSVSPIYQCGYQEFLKTPKWFGILPRKYSFWCGLPDLREERYRSADVSFEPFWYIFKAFKNWRQKIPSTQNAPGHNWQKQTGPGLGGAGVSPRHWHVLVKTAITKSQQSPSVKLLQNSSVRIHPRRLLLWSRMVPCSHHSSPSLCQHSQTAEWNRFWISFCQSGMSDKTSPFT